MTPAQFVRKHYPKAKREHSALGYQIVANGETLGRSGFPNWAWVEAARAIADAQKLPRPRPWESR